MSLPPHPFPLARAEGPSIEGLLFSCFKVRAPPSGAHGWGTCSPCFYSWGTGCQQLWLPRYDSWEKPYARGVFSGNPSWHMALPSPLTSPLQAFPRPSGTNAQWELDRRQRLTCLAPRTVLGWRVRCPPWRGLMTRLLQWRVSALCLRHAV